MVRGEHKAGLFKRAWIILYSVVYTGWSSFRVVAISLSGKQQRQAIDRVIRRWARKLVDLAQIRYQVHGDLAGQLVPGRPTIVMSTHSSTYDIPLSYLAVPGSLRMLAKKELFRIPVLSAGMRAAEMISINRQDRQHAIADLRRAREKMESGVILWLAPEGTRSRDGALLPLKKGGFHLAIDTGAIIIPMVFRNIHRVLPANSSDITLGVEVDVCFGKAIDAALFGKSQRQQLTDEVTRQMQTLLAAGKPFDGERDND